MSTRRTRPQGAIRTSRTAWTHRKGALYNYLIINNNIPLIQGPHGDSGPQGITGDRGPSVSICDCVVCVLLLMAQYRDHLVHLDHLDQEEEMENRLEIQ